MEISLYSRKTKTEYFLVPTCANYTLISRGVDYSTNHIHPVYHFMVITDGEGTLESDKKTYSLKEKDIVIVHPNEKHIYASGNKDGMTYYTLNFYLLSHDNYTRLNMGENWKLEDNEEFILRHAETARLDKLFNLNITEIYCNYNKLSWDKIIEAITDFSNRSVQYYENIIREWINKSPWNHSYYNSCSSRLFWELCSILSSENFSESGLENDDPLLSRIISYLDENIHEKYSLKKLAAQLKYSHIYLCSYFGQKTEMTISEYFNRLKVSRACNYLRTTDKSISEISNLLSFSSPNHFSRNFSKVKNVSPKYFRKHLEIT